MAQQFSFILLFRSANKIKTEGSQKLLKLAN